MIFLIPLSVVTP